MTADTDRICAALEAAFDAEWPEKAARFAERARAAGVPAEGIGPILELLRAEFRSELVEIAQQHSMH